MLTPELGQLLEDVCAFLTTRGPWTVIWRGDDRHPLLQSADGPTLWVSSGGYNMKDRIYFSCSWPKYRDGRENTYLGYQVTSPSITVSDKKSAKQIAADLERRLLPAYLPLWDKQKESVEASETYADKRAILLRVLAGKTAGTYDPNGSQTDINRKPRVEYPYRDRGEGGRVTDVESYENRVSFKVDGLSGELAAQVINLIYGRTK